MASNAILSSRSTLLGLTSLAFAAACGGDDNKPHDEKDKVTADANGGGNDGGESNGGGASADPDWRMLGYDSQSTYNNKAETKITVDTAPNLKKAWTADLGGNINAAPIQIGDMVYITVVSPAMSFAYDLSSGDMVWQTDAFSAGSTMAYADGTLYAFDVGGVIHALDPDTGDEKWQLASTDQGGMFGFSSPMIGGDLIVAGGSTFQELLPGQAPTFRGFVFAANKDGSEAWNTYTVGEDATGASLWSSVAFDPDDGRIYAGTGNNYGAPATDTSDALIALDMDDGAIQWKNQRYEKDTWSGANPGGGPDYDFGANPIAFQAEVDGEVTKLVAGGQKSGDVHVLRADDGSKVWTRNISPGSSNGAQGIFNNGAWDGTHLLYAGNNVGSSPPATLVALDPATGDVAWERDLPGPVFAPITVANGAVGFVGAGSTLQAFDTSTGDVLFEYEAPATIASAPTVANGRVAFGSGIQWYVAGLTTGSILTVLDLP